MNEDFKTKVLIAKSKQEKKVNLLFKLFFVISCFILSTFIFILFKDNFINYFFKTSNMQKKNELIDDNFLKPYDKSSNTNDLLLKKQKTVKNIIEKCEKYNLAENICNIKNLYPAVLKEFNEKFNIILSNHYIKELFKDQLNHISKIRENSLKSYRENSYEKAYTEIIDANNVFDEVNYNITEEFKKNFSAANKAYINRNKNLALELIKIAEKYDPSNKEVYKLKKKIKTLEEIIKLEKEIENVALQNNTKAEIKLINQVKLLDDKIDKYDERLRSLRLLEKEKVFNGIVLDIQDFIKSNNIVDAKKKISEAKKIFPNSSIITMLTNDIESLEKSNQLKTLKKEINALLEKDNWLGVEKKYQQILLLDNTNLFAVDGLKVASKINNLNNEIKIFNNKPLLLTKKNNLDKANSLLEITEIYISKSIKLRKNSELLFRNINLANIPSVVNIKSDGKTDIKVKKVGVIGKVTEKNISLKAGKYVFEGRRQGFKTVLIEKSIALDEKKVNLEIVCNEPI